MQPFQIKGQAHQTPFTSGGGQAAQRELTEAQHLLDNTDDRFDGGLAQTIDGLADVGLKFVGHLLDRTGVSRRGSGLFSKVGSPTVVMGFASGGDVRINATHFHLGDGIGAEVVSNAPAVGLPTSVGIASKVGMASPLSFGWFERVLATIKKLS